MSLALYKCEGCGRESSAPGECCGTQMKQVA